MLKVMTKFKFNLSSQDKLIIFGLLISTAIIMTVSYFAIGKIREELYENYANSGQILGRTIAIQSFELTKKAKEKDKKNIYKYHTKLVLEGNPDISFIAYKNQNGDIIYSSEQDYKERKNDTKTNLTTPVLDEAGKITGYVDIGLNANLAKSISNTTKNSMLVVFALMWLIYTVVVLVNTVLIRRELGILSQGVKEISSGKFGTILEHKLASGELKELFTAFNDMSRRLHLYEEQNIDQLTLERNKFESVLMGIANGVIVCDSEDKVVLINPSAQKLINKEILNTSILDFIDNKGSRCFKSGIEKFKQSPLEEVENKPYSFSITADKKVIKAIVSSMYSNVHDYLGYIIILIDITKEAEVDKLKNDFISNVSHELRTPVTILRSYIDTLYNYGESFKFEEQKEFIEIINNEIIHLNNMVNDILDFSKLEADTKIEKQMLDISGTIERTLVGLKVLADEKNMEIFLIKQENLPLIPYNEEAIERVINNLVVNAIKYSPEKSKIEITVGLTSDNEFMKVSVKDEGIGIEKDVLDRVFDRFYRTENTTHTIKGTGLGLHLVKTAIEKQHDGKVFVESEINKGSTFSFILPVKENVAAEEKISL